MGRSVGKVKVANLQTSCYKMSCATLPLAQLHHEGLVIQESTVQCGDVLPILGGYLKVAENRF